MLKRIGPVHTYASARRLTSFTENSSTAFDRAAIVAAAVGRLRGKSSYTALPAFLLPPLFTLSELHATYQRVLGARLDLASFRRKIIDQGIVETTGTRRVGAHRPAELFRLRAGQASLFQNRI